MAREPPRIVGPHRQAAAQRPHQNHQHPLAVRHPLARATDHPRPRLLIGHSAPQARNRRACAHPRFTSRRVIPQPSVPRALGKPVSNLINSWQSSAAAIRSRAIGLCVARFHSLTMIVMHNNRNAALKRNSPPPHAVTTAHGRGHAAILPRWRIAILLTPALFVGLLPAVLYAQSDNGAASEDAVNQQGNAVETQPMKDGIDLRADDVQAAIRIANPAKLRPGSKVDVTAHFNVAPGWH